MRISLSPQLTLGLTEDQFRMDRPMLLEVAGEVVTINGIAFDFAPLPDGYVLPPEAIDSPFILEPVRRIGGELRITLVLPHGPAAPEATRFPAAIVDPPDGAIALPPFGRDPAAVSVGEGE